MGKLETQFEEAIHLCEENLWEIAESLGYERGDNSAELLIRVYLPRFLTDYDVSQKETLLEQMPPREGDTYEFLLGKGFLTCIFARKQNSIHFLCTAQRALGAVHVLLQAKDGLANAFACMNKLQNTIKEVGESSERRKNDLIASVLSDMARKGAAAAHVETNKLKREVIEYWHEKIDFSLSNEKAATELVKQFPLAHRTLRDYVAEAKKELRSAGKA